MQGSWRTRAATFGLSILTALLAATPASAQRTAAAGAHANRTAGSVQVVVQFDQSLSLTRAAGLIESVRGQVTGDLHIIHGLAARVPADALWALRETPGVAHVDADAPVKPQAKAVPASWGTSTANLATAYPSSVGATTAWAPNATTGYPGYTGAGVTVAVLDTGIAGAMPDFKKPDGTSRVIESVVTNPNATTAGDTYGHGTHVAGIIAGNSWGRDSKDVAYGKYLGIAPDANLVSIKAADDQGNATVLDVIYGLQFAVDHQADYNIRVVNLSLESTVAQSYLTDPLDAAVESAWLHGIVVVAAAGNLGTAPDAVSYAPANDPYVITVGAVDEQGTAAVGDDTIPSWSSRGRTQDGFAKPDVLAPGAHIVGPLAPGSDFAALCPSCVVDGGYIRLSGTSMAAPIVAGVVADVLSVHPGWTPDQVKGALGLQRSGEVAADLAVLAPPALRKANVGLVPSTLLTPSGDIDYTRASWGRASWSAAVGDLRASWGRASWGCDCAGLTAGTGLTRASWGRASWSAYFDG
jgi:serine protease AprX